MILVTTKMSEKVFKNCNIFLVTKILPLIQKLKIIYPWKNSNKLEILDLSRFENKKNECQKYKFITSGVAKYEIQLNLCDYPLY